MDNLRYHQSLPENNSPGLGYQEFSSVDFVLDAVGRKLVPNSIRIEADLVINSTGTTAVAVGDAIQIDNQIGAHCFWESWQVSLPESQGLIQNAQEYPRYMKSVAAGTLSRNDYFDGKLACELRGGLVNIGRINCQALGSNNAGSAQSTHSNNFCIKPMICLNRMVGAGGYSFAKYGQIRISTNLARDSNALYGPDGTKAGNDLNYSLSNVRIRYQTIPDDGKVDKLMMNSYTMIKNSINGSAANVATLVPSKAVSGVTINFLSQSSESNRSQNSYALQKYPQMAEVSYQFSDATNQYVSYTLTSLADVLKKGLSSLKSAGYDLVDMDNYMVDQGFIAGVDFNDQFIDLSKNKFAVEFKSNTALGAYYIYLYFHTMIALD